MLRAACSRVDAGQSAVVEHGRSRATSPRMPSSPIATSSCRPAASRTGCAQSNTGTSAERFGLKKSSACRPEHADAVVGAPACAPCNGAHLAARPAAGSIGPLDPSQAELDQHRMMIACPIAGGAVNDLAADDLDHIIGKDMVDAHGRALVRIDEVGRN